MMMTLVVVMAIVAAGVLVLVRAFNAGAQTGLRRSRYNGYGDSASTDGGWIVGGFGGDSGGGSDCSSSDSGGGCDGGGGGGD
jgi:hypothetical protein